MSLKSRIEAILFLTDKPLKAQVVARIVNEDVQLVRQAVLELINDYEQREGALEIADDDGYIIQVKDQYGSIIDEFVPLELPMSLLRTLSAIAIKQPVMQSEVIKIRGAGAYDHVKELLERELIIKKEEGGRSPTLSTTKKFQEYFRLSQDAKSLRHELKQQVKAEEESAALQLAAQQLILPELVGGDASPVPANQADRENLSDIAAATAGSAGVSPASSGDSQVSEEPAARVSGDVSVSPPAGSGSPVSVDPDTEEGNLPLHVPADKMTMEGPDQAPPSTSSAMTQVSA